MKYFTHILFLLAITWSGVRVCAQKPVVVKDYNNCTEGLQNAKGEWIAPPVYQQIYPFYSSNYTICIRDGKYGLLNADGTEAIATRWNILSRVQLAGKTRTTYPELYVGYLHDSTFILDTLGKIVLGSTLEFSNTFIDSAAIATDKNYNKYFIHLDGSVYPLPSSMRDYPGYTGYGDYYKVHIDSLIVNPQGITHTRPCYGLVNSKAQVIVPPRYDNVQVQHDWYPLIEVTNGKYTGYYSITGKQLWECAYTNLQWLNNYGQGHLTYGALCAQYKGKWGAMNWKGDTLVPFIYDTIPRPILSNNHEVVDTSFIVMDSNGQFGIYHYRKGWVISPHCTNLFPVFRQHGYYASEKYFAVQQNKKWGCISIDGDTVLPSVYDSVFFDNNGIFFCSATGITFIASITCFGETGMSNDRYKEWFPLEQKTGLNYVDGDFPNYQGDSTVRPNYAFYDYNEDEQPVQKHPKPPVNPYPYVWVQHPAEALIQVRTDSVTHNKPGFTTWQLYQEEHYFHHEDNPVTIISWTDASGLHWSETWSNYYFGDGYGYFDRWGIVDDSGRVIIAPGIYTQVVFTGKVFTALDSNGITVVIDTMGNELRHMPGATIRAYWGDTVWMSLQSGVSYYTGGEINEISHTTFALYNLSTGKFVTDTTWHITNTFYHSREPQSFETVRGKGMIDPLTLQPEVAPVYRRVWQTDQTFQSYFVMNCDAKCGLVNNKNEMVVDTAYDNIMQIKAASTREQEGKYLPLPGEESLFLFYNQNGGMILYSTITGAKKIDSTARRDILLTIAAQTAVYHTQSRQSRDEGIHYGCAGCKQELYIDTGTSINNWQADYLFDLLFLRTQRVNSFPTYGWDDYTGCGTFNGSSMPTRWNYLAFHPVVTKFTRDSALSILVLPQHELESYALSSHRATFMNVLLFPEGPRLMTLDSLFTGDQWKSVITDSLLSYLSRHKELNADCSRPGMMYTTVADRYLLTSDGINLYPQWEYFINPNGQRPTHVVFIPWSSLEEHLRPDVKSKIRPEQK